MNLFRHDSPGLIMAELDPEAAALWRLPRAVPLIAEQVQPASEASAEQIAAGIRRLLLDQPNHPDGESYRRFLRKYDRDLWSVVDSARSRGDWRAAIQGLELTVAIDPDDARGHCDLALMYRRAGKLDLAATAYRRAIALEPELAVAQTGLGALLLEQDDVESAIAILEHSLKVREGQAGAHYYLGRALGTRGDDDAARDHLMRAIELAPDDPRPPYYLAIALARLGDLAGAKSAVERCLAIDPDLAPAIEFRASLAANIDGGRTSEQ